MSTLTVREYLPEDEPAVLELMAAALGWLPEEPQREFFLWKHRANPFGSSPGWVAVDGGLLVGFRTFMRWEFEREGAVVRAARAVDTATHPAHQGRGVFRMLTLHALEALRADGVAFVFNTPNDNSRPGYLKMGWVPVGTLPVAVRLASVRAAMRVARARVPAQRWSVSCAAAAPADEVLARPEVEALVSGAARGPGLRTRRTAEFLRWRYGFPPLRYRAGLVGPRVEDGMVLFRVRRRGPATEAVIADVLLPPHAAPGRLVQRVLRAADADYALALRPAPAGMVPLPRQGPLLVWRSLETTTMPPVGDWHLTLGDVELF